VTVRHGRALALAGGALCLVYALVAAGGMLLLSPRVPYADPWRFYAHLLTAPWPGNVLTVDNGHPEILPNLLRLLELQVFGGGQWLQIVVGMLLLGGCCLLWGHARPDGGERFDPTVRSGWLLCGALMLLWFGNGRTLAHANESVHAYLVIACLFGGVLLVARPGRRRLVTALLLGLVATLSFGTGAAVFGALLIVLCLRRAHWQELLAWLGATVLALACYFTLPRAGGGMAPLAIEPAWQIDVLLRWLAAPYLYAMGPFADATLQDKLPTLARAVSAPFARLSLNLFGDARQAVWPELGLGLAGLLALVTVSVRAWRRPCAWPRPERLTLAVSWFAVGCGLLVAIARSDYFRLYPTQIYSGRYLAWSSLFWGGLLASAMLRLATRGNRRTAAALPLLAALCLLPSTGWMVLPARHAQVIADRDALGVVTGVLDRNGEHGENVLDEMVAARDVLAQRHTAVFASPHTRLLGARAPAGAALLPVRGLELTAVDNAFPWPGVEVRFEYAAMPGPSLLLVDRAGRVVGLARPAGRTGIWLGSARGTTVSLADLRAVVPWQVPPHGVAVRRQDQAAARSDAPGSALRAVPGRTTM